ncbi:MAG: GNAT family N-acetyltransferase [Oceanobacter sp.]
MSNIEYLPFDQANPADLLTILNQDSIRTHLIQHPEFDQVSLEQWMASKIELDKQPSYRVRAVYIDGDLAGWCALQPDEQGVELAIVIAQGYWGAGVKIFKTMMGWAKECGHSQVVFHLLDTRREYRSLNKLAHRVYRTEMLNRTFTTYLFPTSIF